MVPRNSPHREKKRLHLPLQTKDMVTHPISRVGYQFDKVKSGTISNSVIKIDVCATMQYSIASIRTSLIFCSSLSIHDGLKRSF